MSWTGSRDNDLWRYLRVLGRVRGDLDKDAVIEYWSSWGWQVFGTVTFSVEAHPESAEKCWEKFIRDVSRKFRGTALRYLRTVEFSRSFPFDRREHFHFLAGIDGGVEVEKEELALGMRDCWGYGFSRIVPIYDVEGAVRYVMKYVLKGDRGVDIFGVWRGRRV